MKRWNKVMLAAAAIGCASPAVAVADFVAGNLVIYRVGAGVSTLSNASTAVFIDEYQPNGTLVQSVPLPTAAAGANNPLTASGTATSEGLMTLSPNGTQLVVSGYAAAPGTAGIAGTSTGGVTPVPRGVGLISADETINSATTTTQFTGNNIRSAAYDATANGGAGAIWMTGGNSGVITTTVGGSGPGVVVSSTPLTNIRQTNVFSGQLYISTGSGSAVSHVAAVGTGLPVTTLQTIGTLPGIPTSGSQYGFFFADLDAGVAGVDTLYVADDGVGLLKYSLVTGTWTANGTVGAAADAYRGLTGSVSGTTVTLYATRKGGGGAAGGGELVSLTDLAGFNGAFTGAPSLLATAATNTAFRGISFAPAAIVPEASAFLFGAVACGLLGLCWGKRRLKRTPVSGAHS